MTITPFRRCYRIKTFGFRGSWGQIFRVEQGFRNIGCTIAEEGEDFDFIYSNAVRQYRCSSDLVALGAQRVQHTFPFATSQMKRLEDAMQ